MNPSNDQPPYDANGYCLYCRVGMYKAHLVNCRYIVGLQAAVKEAHKRLDDAGVPKAAGLACDAVDCNTALGHRVKLLIQERDAFHAERLVE